VKAVDLFSGWGGFTEGATQAGVQVLYAVNHWPLAVTAHSINHPQTDHVCQDLRQADFTKLPDYDLLLAAPACQGHSTASQPRRRAYHDSMRTTAWSVIDCVEATLPKAVIVENVPAFRRWLHYVRWTQCLRAHGYDVEQVLLTATDFGVPQRRERIFIVATRKRADLRFPRAMSEPAFGPCLQWDKGRWRAVTAAGAGAQNRIERSRVRCGSRFLTQHTRDHMGVPLNEPIRTITAKDQWAIVDGEQYRPLTIRELARGMGFSDRYRWPLTAKRNECVRGLGNAVPPPMARALIERVAQVA